MHARDSPMNRTGTAPLALLWCPYVVAGALLRVGSVLVHPPCALLLRVDLLVSFSILCERQELSTRAFHLEAGQLWGQCVLRIDAQLISRDDSYPLHRPIGAEELDIWRVCRLAFDAPDMDAVVAR